MTNTVIYGIAAFDELSAHGANVSVTILIRFSLFGTPLTEHTMLGPRRRGLLITRPRLPDVHTRGQSGVRREAGDATPELTNGKPCSICLTGSPPSKSNVKG